MDKFSLSDVTSFVLNGVPVEVESRPGERLSEALREKLNARDVKVGCNAGDCGACTVLVENAPICACLTATQQVAGRHVETLRGLLAKDDGARALADAFHNHGAAQCGVCTPGMIVSAVPLLRRNTKPSSKEVEDALNGVLCRCTGYRKIIEAIQAASEKSLRTDGDEGIGARLLRLDGRAKVEGEELYGDDIAPTDTLELFIVRSPHPRAAFTFGDLEAYRKERGFEAVLTAADIPGLNRFGVIPGFVDQPVFAETETRFQGEAVAAIVASPMLFRAGDETEFPISWQPLTAVESIELAQEHGAPLLHEERAGNVMCRGLVKCGDAGNALSAAAHRVRGRFASGFVEHAYIEPEAGYAQVEGERIHIHACTQAPVMDQESVAEIMGLDKRQIRIVPTGVGGGFGSKLDISVQPYLALAAWKTGQPVRLTYTRRESMQSTTKRHPSQMRLEIGADAEGRISGFDFEGVFNTGAYASWGPTVANRVPVHASGPYAIRDYSARSAAIHTNCPPSGAFRGFGVPQAALAQETLFDALAESLSMDPLEFRILNALENGSKTVCGQVFEQGVGIKACLTALRSRWSDEREAAATYNENAKAGAQWVRRGVGVAAGWYGCGNTSLPNPSTILAGIRPDGQIVLHQGAMDIGQGSNTAITQIFAEALGVPATSVELVGADTDLTPDAGKTSASRQTFVSGNAARLAGEALRYDVLKLCNASTEAELRFRTGTVEIVDKGRKHFIELSRMAPSSAGYVLSAEETYDPPTGPLDKSGQGAPYAQFGYAAHMAVIEVDIALGTVKPQRFIAAHDVGRAINPLLIEGQVEGGIAQGLGMALMEEYIPGRTENLHDYLIPTIGDMPPVETLIVEEPDAHGPYGAKGLGEHVLIPTAPALLNAITHATGVRLTRVPATPSAVHAALKAAQNG